MSNWRSLMVPIFLTLTMLACGLTAAGLAGLHTGNLFGRYISTSVGITVLASMLSIFVWITHAARLGLDNPLEIVVERVKGRSLELLFPVLIFPMFLASYTAAKGAIPFLVGYTWDTAWAQADHILMGRYAWEVFPGSLPPVLERTFEWAYAGLWGILFISMPAFVALNASRRNVAVFHTSLFATWLLGGFGVAYACSAAGPVFAGLTRAEVRGAFEPVRQLIGHRLMPGGPIQTSQEYLTLMLRGRVADVGAGISAMPSMHVATAAIYVMLGRRGSWLMPAACFWLFIMAFSLYCGYHYLWDGLIGSAIAVSAYIIAERAYATEPALAALVDARTTVRRRSPCDRKTSVPR